MPWVWPKKDKKTKKKKRKESKLSGISLLSAWLKILSVSAEAEERAALGERTLARQRLSVAGGTQIKLELKILKKKTKAEINENQANKIWFFGEIYRETSG